jgi:hypothetical protein
MVLVDTTSCDTIPLRFGTVSKVQFVNFGILLYGRWALAINKENFRY